ncbi:MAG: DUF1549 domain-containing protein [Planctomycetes bacterium]|nr:DUF1549 domain-containing protein [Planctomycetota bacterium]
MKTAFFIVAASLCGAWSGAAPQERLRKPDFSATIDRVLEGRWAQRKIVPAPLADDGEFLRRLSLDLRGHAPGYPELRAFLADASPDKRLAKIDEYLATEAFASQMSRWLAHLLLGNYNNVSIQPGKNLNGKTKVRLQSEFLAFLKDHVARDTPVPLLLSALLEAQGRTDENPAVLYKLSMWNGEPPAFQFADNASRAWLGIRVSCARCHDHPFDRWSQEDFYGLAGFFAQQKLKLIGDAPDSCQEVELYEDPKAPELPNPDSGAQILKPRFLYGGTLGTHDPRMKALALFISRRDHNQLAVNFANRLWAWFMGRGFVHPEDDFNARNKPLVPELLSAMSRAFVRERYSLKSLARAICASRAYQRTCVRESPGDPELWARASIRQMTVEQLFLSAAVALQGEDAEKLRKGERGKWGEWYARQMVLVFGPGVTWTEVSVLPGNARQMLMIRNGEMFAEMVGHREGLAAAAMEMKGLPAERVERIFLSVLCRPTADAERDFWAAWLEKHPHRQGYEDVVWTLINSTEFLTRH